MQSPSNSAEIWNMKLTKEAKNCCVTEIEEIIAVLKHEFWICLFDVYMFGTYAHFPFFEKYMTKFLR